MRKIKISILASIVALVAVAVMGCSATKGKNVEENIIKNSKAVEKMFSPDINVKVNIERKPDRFLVYPDGMENQAFTMLIPSNWDEQSEFEIPDHEKDSEEISREQKGYIEEAKEIALKYIETSEAIKAEDKDDCRKAIEKTKIHNTYFTEQEYYNAAMVTCDNTIYTNQKLQEYFCEYLYLHEFIHVISNTTNAGSKYEFSSYRASAVNEATTDLITVELAKERNLEIPVTNYQQYYEFAQYLIAKCDYIETYFYSDGYDSMISMLDKDLVDVYFLMVDNLEETSNVIYYIVNELYNK